MLCFGHDRQIDSPIDTRGTGYITNSSLLACYYNAADLFVGASQEEAFGQTFIEAAACGTPAIGYEVGGVPEAIRGGAFHDLFGNAHIVDGIDNGLPDAHVFELGTAFLV